MGKRGKLPENKLPTSTGGQAMPMPTMKPSKEMLDRERRYKAEDALRDIERAEGHKRDSKLMADVKDMAKEKMESLKKVCK